MDGFTWQGHAMTFRPFQLEPKDLGLLFYVLSLLLPAIRQHHERLEVPPVVYGWEVLLTGALAIPDAGIAWLANVAFAVAYLSRKPGRVRVCSAAAIALGLTSFTYSGIWNDGDGRISITGYSYGFYVWMLAFIWLPLSRLVR
ncbi:MULTISPECIES: hypothetical protein [Pseudomonas]|nr:MULTISPECIES: hypothetical protein [Pseudomonas]